MRIYLVVRLSTPCNHQRPKTRVGKNHLLSFPQAKGETWRPYSQTHPQKAGRVIPPRSQYGLGIRAYAHRVGCADGFQDSTCLIPEFFG